MRHTTVEYKGSNLYDTDTAFGKNILTLCVCRGREL